jgi:REP element-mobilizing transposase RayT
MHVHLVFVTKYRRGVFTQPILDDLQAIFSSVCADFEAELIEFDGQDDHVHLLVNYPPKIAVSALVNSLKGVSSRMIRQKIIPVFVRNSGAMLYGHPAILQEVVAAPLSLSFVSILRSSKHLSNHRQRRLGRLRYPASP